MTATENYLFSGRILNWFHDSESRTWSRLHLSQNEKNKKSAVLGLTLQTYGHSENCGIGKTNHSVPAS